MMELLARSVGPSRSQLVVSGIAGAAIAGVATIIRLAIRMRKGRLWWDDALALLSLLFLIVTIVAGNIQYTINENSTIPQHTRVSLYYSLAITFDITIWLSRLSVLFNIMRLGSYRRRLQCAAALFTVALLILIAQVVWVCEPQDKANHWKGMQNPTCKLGRKIAIAQITTDFVADIILVVVPLLLLRVLIVTEETKAQRTRLAASFCVGGMTTVISVVHTVYLLQGNLVSMVISNVEMTVSVIICNFIVLAAALHKLWDHLHPPRDETRMGTLRFASMAGTSTYIGSSEGGRTESKGTISKSRFGSVTKKSGDYSSMGSGTRTNLGDDYEHSEHEMDERKERRGRDVETGEDLREKS